MNSAASQYSFYNLCGSPFTGGDVTFSPEGDRLLSPVGNRVNVYDLVNSKSWTLPTELRNNIKTMALSNDKTLLFAIDVSGYAFVINFIKGTVLTRIVFKEIPARVKFSPCDKYVAVAVGPRLEIWAPPSAETGWQLSRVRVLKGHTGAISDFDWSLDSRVVVTASKDTTVRITPTLPHYSSMSVSAASKRAAAAKRKPQRGGALAAAAAGDDAAAPPWQRPVVLVDHRRGVQGCYLSQNEQQLCSIGSDGMVILWELQQHPLKQQQQEKEKEEEDVNGGVNGLTVKQEQEEQREDDRRNGRKTQRKVREEPIDGEDDGTTQPSSSLSRMLERGAWKQKSKVFAIKQSEISSTAYCKARDILLLGSTRGHFLLFDARDMSQLASLSIGRGAVTAADLTADGEWVCVASADLGQLVVWEWASEAYILKQQGHWTFGVSCVAFAPIGAAENRGGAANQSAQPMLGGGSRAVAATGGADGKVKLWDSNSGYCFVTFADHSHEVTAVVFSPQGNAVFSSSLDGSVHGCDLLRYRRFKTYRPPPAADGAQLLDLALDPSGEILVAAARGKAYEAYVWSVQTAQHLDTLSGHEGPIVRVCFDPQIGASGIVATGSWDKTVRLWNVFARGSVAAEALQHTSEVAALSFDPTRRGRVAVATMGGSIVLWRGETGEVEGTIDAIRDIRVGRLVRDKFVASNRHSKRDPGAADNLDTNVFFSSLAFAPSGGALIAGCSNSARVCIYDTRSRTLAATFQLTTNQSLDGIRIELNSKFMTEAGVAMQELDVSDPEDETTGTEWHRIKRRKKEAHRLPGVNTGQFAPEGAAARFRLQQVAVSRDGCMWAAATSQGLYLYSVDAGGLHAASQRYGALMNFRPLFLTKNVTPANIDKAVKTGQFGKAMVLALALNDLPTLKRVFNAIPIEDVPVAAGCVPVYLCPPLISFLRVAVDVANGDHSTSLEKTLCWCKQTLVAHAAVLQSTDVSALSMGPSQRGFTHLEAKVDFKSVLLSLLRALQTTRSHLEECFESNTHTIAYIVQRSQEAAAASKRRDGGGGGDNEAEEEEELTEEGSTCATQAYP
eukprot:GHVU01107329.1.p1 GENE.GHVU01107329.1~~GHVU01107329.1.p1  ORF type:complete len:1070 (-),score=224.61 GHVU01107329.1:535-3744(-)